MVFFLVCSFSLCLGVPREREIWKKFMYIHAEERSESAAEATEGAEGKWFFRAAFGAGGANGASGERDGRESGERKKEKCNFIYARNDPYK
jgi:hypothetical protein